MILYEVEQGSPEWLAARAGVPTASEFGSIMTAKGTTTATARKYAMRLATEIILGRPIDLGLGKIAHIQRGHTLEEQAAAAYGMENGVEPLVTGFGVKEDGTMGASPDRLIGAVGAVEIKCPKLLTHVGYLCDGFEQDYMGQVQGQMDVFDLEWVDRFSFHPELPSETQRTYRDSVYISKLRDTCAEVCELRDQFVEKIRRKGFVDE